MLCTNNDIELAGATICGVTFHPCDDDEVYAVFHLNNCCCGATVPMGSTIPYLRLTPGVQIPPAARAGFDRFLFECDDDEMVDLKVDTIDGELVLRRNLNSLDPGEVERVLDPALHWIDNVAFPAVMAYIADVYRDKD